MSSTIRSLTEDLFFSSNTSDMKNESIRSIRAISLTCLACKMSSLIKHTALCLCMRKRERVHGGNENDVTPQVTSNQ